MVTHLTLTTAILFLASDPIEKDPTKTGQERNKQNIEKFAEAIKKRNDSKVSLVFSVGVAEPYPLKQLIREDHGVALTAGPGFLLSEKDPRSPTVKGYGPGTATIKYTFDDGPKGKAFTVVVELVFVKPER